MRSKVTVVGAGNVGATTAQRIFDGGYADVVLTDGTTITVPEIERKTIALQAGLSFMPFPEYQVRPYVLGGLGYYRSRYTSPDLPRESVSDSGYFAGFGVDLLGGQWNGDGSLVVEARWLFTQKEQYAEQRVRSDGFTVTVGFRIKTM